LYIIYTKQKEIISSINQSFLSFIITSQSLIFVHLLSLLNLGEHFVIYAIPLDCDNPVHIRGGSVLKDDLFGYDTLDEDGLRAGVPIEDGLSEDLFSVELDFLADEIHDSDFKLEPAIVGFF
jgi:hypothetical protein